MKKGYLMNEVGSIIWGEIEFRFLKTEWTMVWAQPDGKYLECSLDTALPDGIYMTVALNPHLAYR